eukprot:CAMPEP_0201663366 /NCGR_PEP_ID=MMETSP0494-20130426/5192_1 /ASSEMBLY_ACC=CAM_ASM_000839 /TAXON_ID=420259 /ORGANISM="Thalassiosira gravida, Strain GMp14c1" /LENGTH=39 /DNA_ID= /DNA_START= /DNA_END= /DNA_ORIENTATION=
MGSKGLPERGGNDGTTFPTVPMYDIGAYEQRAGVSTIKF